MKKLSRAVLATLLMLAMTTNVFAKGFIEIPAGTPVSIVADRVIDADEVKVGENVNFSTLDPIKVNGKTIIKSGTQVVGQVAKIKNNNICGISGDIRVGNFKLKTKQGDYINLRGIVRAKGVAKAWVNWGWLFWVTLPMVFVKGDDGIIDIGNFQILYTIGDYAVQS